MKIRLTSLLPLLLVALIIACFEIKTQTVPTGMSQEARLNPWLAAGRLLEKQKLQVRFEPSYGGLPSHADVLMLATPLDYLDKGERETLLGWVRRGGHLVSELQEPSDSAQEKPEELLASQFDVRLLRHDFNTRERAAARKGIFRPTQVDREGLLQAGFKPDYHLLPGRQRPAWAAGDVHGLHALRYGLEAGHVTLLSDIEWMHNGRLAQGDNGALLTRVVNARAGQKVWLVYGVERPSLLQIIWTNLASLLVAVALFVLVWLWAASRRFGPLRPRPEAARRRLAEHLEASGRYLLRHDGLGQLFDASRQRLLAQVQRRHPQWRQLPPAELAEQLAQRARLESAAVRRVLEGNAPDQLLQFAADIRLLNRLRKAL